jgi:hypothetical protein
MLSRLPYFLILANLTAVSVAVVLGGKRPDVHFAENGFITQLNVMQLIAAAGLSLCIAAIRRREPNSGQVDSRLWLLVAAGGLWFAMDETFEIHEHLGWYLRQVHSVTPPPILNQRSDPLLAFDLVAIFAVCWLCRREILYDRRALRFFAAGAGLLVVSEVIDFFVPTKVALVRWWNVAEEASKIIGFGTVLAGLVVRFDSALAELLESVHQAGAATPDSPA